MEASPQLLLNDSFSYGWLINAASSAAAAALGDSHRSVDTQDGSASFIEIDPHFLSMRWSAADRDAGDFDFDLDLPSSHAQVHADQIFSDGLLLPLPARSPSTDEAALCSGAAPDARSALRKSRSDNSNRYATSVSSSPALFHSAKSSPYCASPDSAMGKFESRFGRRCAKSAPKKIICKYLCFLMPLLKMVKDLRLVSSNSSKSTGSSCRSSPRASSALSSLDWYRRNADVSIYDAVLHCKKSIGQDKYTEDRRTQ